VWALVDESELEMKEFQLGSAHDLFYFSSKLKIFGYQIASWEGRRLKKGQTDEQNNKDVDKLVPKMTKLCI
jgi:hypothetical protein